MTRIDCDLAILGSGFGGTLLAIIARKLGYSVALIERGTHPRFAIGESSTPLADFKLARLADAFGLDWLRPFSKYGTWKATTPHMPCGMKRGFSFFRHYEGKPFEAGERNANALVVAASPTDATADTHWFRASFDSHIVDRAVTAGVPYLDRCEVHTIRHTERGWELDGTRPDDAVNLRAAMVIDATGNGQALGESLGLQPIDPIHLKARSRALYSHFTGVELWHDVLQAEGGPTATAEHPFPCDAAALHQIIDHGWMWILRFENGITSAGFSLDPDHHPLRSDETPEAEWQRLLQRYPSLARQFTQAQPVRPFTRTGRLQRRYTRASGPDWALLPHAAGFLDAWLSPGIAQTLFAVNRLASILADKTGREQRLAEYGETVLRELAWVDEITGTCFACFDRFPAMAVSSMVYFTAAVYCEERERRGEAGPDEGFLLADHPAYREVAATIFRQALAMPAGDGDRFLTEARRLLAPYDSCGLCDPTRRNMYPYTASHKA